jgi:hypothetical protein
MSDGFRLEPKQYNLDFEDPKLDGLQVQLTGMSMQEALDLDLLRFAPWKGVEDNAERQRAIAETIVAHLAGWNLTEKDRTPTPPTADGLLSHDQEIQTAIVGAYGRAIRGVPAPLGSGSTNGEGVDSLPTETLPASP